MSDSHSFRELFEAHYRAVIGYSLRRTGSAADAADVLSETMTVAWRRFDERPPAAETRAWLLGIARRVLANQRRGSFRRNRLVERLSTQIDMHEVPTVDVAERAWVLTALGRLDQVDQEVLTLTVWEQLTSEEVGLILDVPAATVRSRLHRARRRLRDELDRTRGEQPEHERTSPER